MKALKSMLCLAALAAATLPLLGHAERANRVAPAARGKQVFDRWCAACHSTSHRAGGTSALAAKYGTDLPAALEQRTDLEPDLIGYFVRHGVSVMPTFRKTEIPDADLVALSAYLTRNNGKAKKP